MIEKLGIWLVLLRVLVVPFDPEQVISGRINTRIGQDLPLLKYPEW